MRVLSLTLKKGKYEVIFSNGDTILVNEDMVVSHRLVKGKEIDFETYDQIRDDIIFYEAYTKAYSYALAYQKSSKQIYEYLLKKEYSKDISRRVVDELNKNKITDDDSIKNQYVSKLVREGHGRLAISYKLKEKGFSSDFEVDEDEYQEALDKLISSKIKTLKDKKKERLMRYLSSRGYSFEEINRALRGINFD